MKQVFSQKNITLVVITLLVAIVPFGYISVRYLLDHIQSDVEELQIKRIDQSVQQNFLASAGELEQQKKFIESNQDQIEVLLGNDDDETIELYTAIERLAAESQISSIALRVEEYTGAEVAKDNTESPTAGRGVPEKNEPAQIKGATAIDGPARQNASFKIVPASDKYLYLNVSTIGTYNDIISFMHKIENTVYFSDILELRIRTYEENAINGADATDDTRANLVDANIYIAFYLSGGATRDERLRDPAAGLSSKEMLGL